MKQIDGGVGTSAAKEYLQILFSGTSWEMNGMTLEIGADPATDSFWGNKSDLYRSITLDDDAYTGILKFGDHGSSWYDLKFDWDNANSGEYWFAGTDGDQVTLIKADDPNTEVVLTRITEE